MTLSRRRIRSQMSCSTPNRSRSGMATTVAVTLLAILNSQNGLLPSTTTADAFTLPLSAVRLTHKSQLLYKTSDSELSDVVNHDTTPVRTTGPLTRLTHQQEVSLLKQMRAHPAHTSLSQTARQTLLMHNLPLVQSIVTKTLKSRPHLQHGLKNGGKSIRQPLSVSSLTASSHSTAESQVGAALTRDDLLHEGTIGLAEAIDRYDLAYANGVDSPPTKADPTLPPGARLGTYATYWIRARILRAIQSREHAFRFPEHVLQASHRLVRSAKEMGVDWHVVMELADYDVISVAQKKMRDELREAAGIKSEGLFRDAVRVRSMSQRSTTPLESWMAPSCDSAIAMNEDEVLSDAGQEQILETLSKFLVPREVEVLSWRFGLASAEEEDVESSGDLASSPLGQRVSRNYEAEAEEDLFGPNGMLSHYSATPNESVAAVAATPKATEISSSPATTTAPKMATLSSRPPTLLPFKEIGKRMKFSGEYCRRTCTVALNKLTCAVEEGRLAESDFLLGFS